MLIDDESGEEFLTPDMLAAHLDSCTALVTLSVVQYRSGALHDVAALTKMAHDSGALVVWDVSHAVGVVDMHFDRDDIDLAVGCTYKYGNAGPGSPAWLYVNRRLQGSLRVPIQGWFAQRDQFAMVHVQPRRRARACVAIFIRAANREINVVSVEVHVHDSDCMTRVPHHERTRIVRHLRQGGHV
ncbi:MAG: aminotransferase class V-fold PLP-dependent enzyme, partial [Actinomycetota bacterium]